MSKKLPVALWAVLLVIWVFVAVISTQFLIGFLLVAILGSERLSQPIWSGIYSALAYAAALALIIYVPHKLRTNREEMGLKGWPTWTDIGLGPIGYIVGILLAMALSAIFSMFPWFNADEAQEVGFSLYLSGFDKVIAFFSLVVVAPVMEELIFRGWLYGKMRARLSAPASILLVSLVFAILHFQWNVGVTVFALSVVLCVLREITGTVYAGIITHMLKNGVAFYLLYIAGT